MLFQSHAKVNLRLKVLGRKDNGYHLLSMLNVLVSLADQVNLELLDDSDIICEFKSSSSELDLELNNASNNIAAKAAKLIFKAADITCGLKISAIKKIPVGGGLGGGSSNAAVVLKELPKLLLDQELITNHVFHEIQRLLPTFAIQLGSDVFFILYSHGGLHWVQGTGDVISEIASGFLKGKDIILLQPNFGMSSQLVYDQLRRMTDLDTSNRQSDYELESWVKNLKYHPEDTNYITLLDLIDNDLWQPFIQLVPQIARYKEELSKFSGIKLGLSGSGSTLFGLPNNGVKFDQLELEKFCNTAKNMGFSIIFTSIIA